MIMTNGSLSDNRSDVCEMHSIVTGYFVAHKHQTRKSANLRWHLIQLSVPAPFSVPTAVSAPPLATEASNQA